MRIPIVAVCLAVACHRPTAQPPRSKPPATANDIDGAYSRFIASAPAFSSGPLGTYAALEHDGAIGVGTLERAGIVQLPGAAPAIAVSSDRIAVAAIAGEAMRVTILDREMKTVATTDVGPAYRGARIGWSAATSQWIVAWSSIDPLSTQDMRALEKRGELIPINKKEERIHVARLDPNGNLLAQQPLHDGEVVDLAVDGLHFAVLTQRLANDLACKPALPSLYEVRLVVDGTEHEHERLLVRACVANLRHLDGSLVAVAGRYGAIVAACTHNDARQLVVLRFDAAGAPAAEPSVLGPVDVPRTRGPLFDAAVSDGGVRVASVDAGKLTVALLDSELQPQARTTAGTFSDARAIAVVGSSLVVLGESRSTLVEPPIAAQRTSMPAAAYDACH